MNKENYVSFEVAKLLREKGFNEPCEACYHNDNSSTFRDSSDKERFKYCEKGFLNARNFYRDAAPTLWEAHKWLREKHGIDIDVNIFSQSREYISHISKYKVYVICNPIMKKTYEDALNAGILKALEWI